MYRFVGGLGLEKNKTTPPPQKKKKEKKKGCTLENSLTQISALVILDISTTQSNNITTVRPQQQLVYSQQTTEIFPSSFGSPGRLGLATLDSYFPEMMPDNIV